MKGKTALTLMEQAIMLLVLALAAALCLRAFLWSDTHSRENSSRDQALIQLQRAAEVLKSQNGDFLAASAIYGGHAESQQWVIGWDESWVQTDNNKVFQLVAIPQDSQIPYLGSALLTLQQSDSTLCSLQICWQEVQP